MVTIDAFQPTDRAVLTTFVEAIQEYERAEMPELKLAGEIGATYVDLLICNVAERNGCIRMARAADAPIGFSCAWMEDDDDPLLRDDARRHAYVSDIFVLSAWRRQGVALRLLHAVEAEMRSRGCRRIRICSKATNRAALKCYERAGYHPYEIVLSKSIDS